MLELVDKTMVTVEVNEKEHAPLGQGIRAVGICFYKRGDLKKGNTVEPRFNEPLFNEFLDIMNNTLCPSQNYSKMYGIEPQYNEPRYNDFFDITNYNVKTGQKIIAEQINSQQIL